jgi:dipeptidyl aminopeptidase/acylaminoacyl peptidase
VGAFSADGDRWAVHADGLEVVDLDSGRVVARAAAEADAVTRAAWRPDGSAIDFVSGRELVTVGTDGEVSSQETTIPQEATLAWSPRGDELADLHEESGINRLYLSPLRKDGTLAPGEQVDTTGLSLQHLLGFSSDRTVAVDAFVLESGSVERVIDVSLDGRTRTDLTTLPPPGENWDSTSTVAVATDTLFKGSYTWPNPLWPWSYEARLGACALLMFFLFGLYVTRRPRT